jgi:RNA polymerase sigma factor (sigma-70 family)
MKPSLLFLTSDAKILDLIRTGDEKALVTLYESNRKPIAAYIARNSGTTEDAQDVLQESLVILWERIRAGRFEYKAQLNTFIYATVRNLWSQRLRKKKHLSSAEIDPEAHEDQSPSVLDSLISTEQVEMVRDALVTIGEQCRKLLLLFYWEEQTMEEIAVRLKFANADTAKAKKYQCKKALERALSRLQ